VILEELDHEIDLELFFRPLRIPPERLVSDLPPAKLLVATAYQTAPLVAVAAAAHPGTQTGYFVQDYEGWFGADGPEYVERTYDLIPRMTAISGWLADTIAERHGHRPVVVPVGADPETFYPRGDRAVSGPVRIVAMLRPDERRGIGVLLQALSEVARRESVEIVFFGAHPYPKDAPPLRHRHLGILSREAVARLLSTAHVVVDPSLFQGFGLVGLEGMACAAACALTDSGGIREYAVDGENALVVPPGNPQALADAILRLVSDPALRDRLGAAGVATSRQFTWERTAERYRAFMASLPPAETPTPLERAALDLLGRELVRGSDGSAPLRSELKAARQTLEAIYRSRAWRLVTPWRRLKQRFTG
jgi:glycosyltransferase involved in cell wall biosynthesis